MSYTYAATNSEAIQRIAEVYLPEAYKVLDPTYGKGNFWKWDHRLEVTQCDLVPTSPDVKNEDFRRLSFADQTFDAAVFDPPYYGHGARTMQDQGVRNSRQNVWFLEKDEPVRNLYMKGLMELSRVVKNNGIIIVKVTDGCDYPRMADWIVGLGIGKYLDTVIRVNLALRNWTPNKGPRKKLRSVYSSFIVLRNSYFGQVSP